MVCRQELYAKYDLQGCSVFPGNVNPPPVLSPAPPPEPYWPCSYRLILLRETSAMVSRYFTAESSLFTNASTVLFITVVLIVILVTGWMTKWESKYTLLALWQYNYSKINLNLLILFKIKVLVVVIK